MKGDGAQLRREDLTLTHQVIHTVRHKLAAVSRLRDSLRPAVLSNIQKDATFTRLDWMISSLL